MFERVMRAPWGGSFPPAVPRVPLGTHLDFMRLRSPLTPSTPGPAGPFACHTPQAQHALPQDWLLLSIFTLYQQSRARQRSTATWDPAARAS